MDDYSGLYAEEVQLTIKEDSIEEYYGAFSFIVVVVVDFCFSCYNCYFVTL